MFSAILSKIGFPFILKLVRDSVLKTDHALSQSVFDSISDLLKDIETGQVPAEKIQEANRHIEKLASLDTEEFKTLIQQVNQSLRAEVASNDPYVRRMRPTFGYIMAITWGAQMFSVAYIILFDPEKASAIISSMGALSTIWGVGLSVLGVYVYKRSQEKTIVL